METGKEVNSIIIKTGKKNNPYFNLIENQAVTKRTAGQKRLGSALLAILPPYPFEKLAELYELNSYHARAMQLKAALTCMSGYNLVTEEENKLQDDDYKKIANWIEGHSAYAAQTFLTSIYNFCLDREIFGNAFFEIVRNNKNEIAGFYHLPARNCGLVKESNTVKLVQEISGDRTEFLPFGSRETGASEFVMLKSYHPKSVYYGLPDYMPALAAIVLDRSAVKFNIKRFDNNMVLEHIITVIGAAFGGSAKKDIKDFFTNNFSGIDNAGKSLLLEVDGKKKNDVGIEVHKVSSETREGSYLELRKETKEEIIAAHGVPPRLVGIASAGQLGGTAEVKEQMRMFRDIIIKPRQKEVEFIFNNFILKDAFPLNKKWKIKLDTFEISDAADDAKFYESIMNIEDAEGRKVLSAEEIREELGYKAVKKV
jgi:PBSX family phage portal protein